MFCAYGKKQSPQSDDAERVVPPAPSVSRSNWAYNDYDLTPCTGDVFMDRHLFDKLTFLDETPGVKGYGFYTNFAVPRLKDIDRLAALKKLSGIGISVYGHDLDTFLKISRTTEANLSSAWCAISKQILAIHQRQKFQMHVALHAGARLPSRPQERDHRSARPLQGSRRFDQAVEKCLTTTGAATCTQDDVRGLPIRVIVGEDAVYKNGACVRLFTTIQIMATGIVNGCACRDADATLQLGDLTDHAAARHRLDAESGLSDAHRRTAARRLPPGVQELRFLRQHLITKSGARTSATTCHCAVQTLGSARWK